MKNKITNLIYIVMMLSFMQTRRFFSVIRYWDIYQEGLFEVLIIIFSLIFYVATIYFIILKIDDIKKDYKKLIGIVLIFILTRSLFLNLILILVYFSKYINKKQIIKIYLIAQLTVLVVAILGIPLASSPEGTGRNDVYLGFAHINVAAFHVFSIITAFIYIFRNTKKLPIFVICGILTCFIFSYLTGSRSLLYSSLIYILLLIPFNFYIKFDKYIQYTRYIFIPIVLIIFIITVILTMNFDYSFLDSFTSTRLRLFKQYIELMNNNYIFGMELLFSRAEYPKALDSSYIHIFYQSGIIGILIVSSLVGFLIKELYRYKRYYSLIIIFSLLVYNMVEAIWELDANFIIIIALCHFSNLSNKENLTYEKN